MDITQMYTYFLSLQYICYYSKDYFIVKYHIQSLDLSIEIVLGLLLCG